MTLQTYAVTVLSFLVLVTVPAVAENAQNVMQRKADEEKMLRMKEILKKADTDISFFGKVVDQTNIPVDGAVVDLHIMHFSPDERELFGESKSITVKTDRSGLFSVENEKGRSIYLDGISKTGYEFMMTQNPMVSFQFAEHGVQKPFVAERNSPVIFKLRKQGATAFCLESKYWDCQISASESGKTKGYDFISRKPVPNLMTPVLNGETLTCDLMVKATLNTNSTIWTVVLSSVGTNCGIIVSEQLLYEAPDTGYQSEYTLTPEDRKPVKAKYVYLKSRFPFIYTRFELNDFNAGTKFLRLNGGTAVTNPYGDRILEQAKDIPYLLTKQLADEVKKSFRENKRPEKPDLPKRIKEFNEKLEREKAEKEKAKR